MEPCLEVELELALLEFSPQCGMKSQVKIDRLIDQLGTFKNKEDEVIR